MNTPSRRQFLAATAGVGIAGLAGCLGALTGTNGPEPSGTPAVGVADPSDVSEPFFYNDSELSRSYDTFADNAVSGGVPKDGIPSIDDPSFEGAGGGDQRLAPGDPVFGVVVDGEARAYPQYILVHHEIVNDTLAGQNIAVTYCPLTGTTLGFDRGNDTFGVSGKLVNSNLIMYDRGSESWWSQVLGSLIRGDSEELLGRTLVELRVIWTTWGRWRSVYPETTVLTEDTGEPINYARDPYGSYNPPERYYKRDRIMFEPMVEDDRFHPKEVFIGARTSDGKVAFRKQRLREKKLLETRVGDVSYLGAYHPELDSAWVYRNPDERSFSTVDNQYEGPDGQRYAADELPLEVVNAFDAMWFAWASFYPETVVV